MCYVLTIIFEFKETSTAFIYQKENIGWLSFRWSHLISHVLKVNGAETPKRFAFYYRGFVFHYKNLLSKYQGLVLGRKYIFFFFRNFFLFLINLTKPAIQLSENIPYYMYIFLFVFRLKLHWRHKSETFFLFSCWKLATLYRRETTELYGNLRWVLCHSRASLSFQPVRYETFEYFRNVSKYFLMNI